MNNKKNRKKQNKGKKRKYTGLYIMFIVAIFMLLFYVVFVNGIMAS